jgi:hypothetical protein
MRTAAALTIRPLPTRLAGVLEGRAADCRGDAHLGPAGDPAAGRLRLGHQDGASGVVPDEAALRQ